MKILYIILTSLILSACNLPPQFLEEEAIKVEEDLYNEQNQNGNNTQTQVKKTTTTKQAKK